MPMKHALGSKAFEKHESPNDGVQSELGVGINGLITVGVRHWHVVIVMGKLKIRLSDIFPDEF